MTRMYLDLAAPFGARDDGGPPELVVEPYDHERAERRLARAPGRGPWLGVNPGAAFGPAKIYPPERVAAAVAAVCRTNGLAPLVLCGPGEEALGGRVAGLLGAGTVSTHERPPDVAELKALLVRCAVLLSTDAGPRHVAEALGVPTAVLMGPTDPRWTAGSPGVVVRQEGLPCLGCHRRTCPIGHPCMETLEPEAVASALRRALASREGPPGGPGGG
jgi:heptosyltransferase-2